MQDKPPITAKTFFAVAAVMVAYLTLSSFFGDRGLVHLWRMKSQRADIASQVQVLKAQNESLTGEVDQLRTADDVLERVAREEHGYARPDETIYHFVEETPEKTR